MSSSVLLAAPAAGLTTDVGPLSGGVPTSFGHDAWWIILVKVVLIFGILLVTTLLTIWGERRIVARMQQRIGPNRVGPNGMLQGLADGVKLMLKEDILPALRDRPVYFVAPIISAVPAFLAFSVIPFGPVVSVAGHHTPLQLTDLPVGALFVLACSSLGVYGVVLSGWSSGSTYPLLGALRAAAQMISYEVAMGLSLVPVFLSAGSLSTAIVVEQQQRFWYAFALLPSFLIYAVSAVGETNRAPFDNAEGETELVGGFHTEYSSIKFAMFFLAEYINLVTVSALATTLFLGGWKAPFHLTAFAWANNGWLDLVWFAGKVFVFIFGFIWLRGTLPRLRYDQFMRLGWKVLVPISLVWVLADAFINTARDASDEKPYIIAGIVVVFLAFVYILLDPGASKRARVRAEQREKEDRIGADAFPTPSVETVRAIVEGRLPRAIGASTSSADGGINAAALQAELHERETARG